jgi:hypothetical protein
MGGLYLHVCEKKKRLGEKDNFEDVIIVGEGLYPCSHWKQGLVFQIVECYQIKLVSIWISEKTPLKSFCNDGNTFMVQSASDIEMITRLWLTTQLHSKHAIFI